MSTATARRLHRAIAVARLPGRWPARLLRFEPQLVTVLGVCIASVQVALLYRADRVPEMLDASQLARREYERKRGIGERDFLLRLLRLTLSALLNGFLFGLFWRTWPRRQQPGVQG